MGEFADYAIDQMFTEWETGQDYSEDEDSAPGYNPWSSRPSRSRTPCMGCGKGALYWKKLKGKWRLHHYTMFGIMTKPDYVLHRCGFESDGTPIKRKFLNVPNDHTL